MEIGRTAIVEQAQESHIEKIQKVQEVKESNELVVDHNKYKEAKKINEDLFQINKILFCVSNPIPIKAAMYLAGLIDTLEYRLPLVPPSKENMKKIEQIISQYEIVS